jgi:hypothetical protein
MTEKAGGKKWLVIVVAVVIVVLLCTIGVMAALLIKKGNDDKKSEATVAPKEVITADNVEEVLEQMEEERKSSAHIPQQYTVSQNTDWEFPDGKSPSTNAYVKNDESNETAVYFDLIVNDTNQIVYSSPILELGAEIEKFTLDEPLSAGVYKCTVHYHLIDDEQIELTDVNIGVTITVNN